MDNQENQTIIDENQIIIDEEFKCLLPELDKETYSALEENLLLNGCRDAIVLWNGILIDGHNRYGICLEHDIPFNTVDKEFGSREEVLIWIISNQVSRRNLSQIQLSHYRGLHYRADKKLQGANNQNVQNSEKRQSDVFPKNQSTAKRLSEKYRVSPRTIDRDAKLAAAIDAIGEKSPEAKRKILSGELMINKGDLERMAYGSQEEIFELAARIEEGTYKKENLKEPVDIPPLETEIIKMAESFYSGLRKLTKSSDNTEIKAVLRAHIDQLEELYRQM
ncbi:MAG: hypothetical protein FWF85_01745 [Clostridiales bacterium]|nr:hypothetical protein [Clostridiales bacterium]